MNQRKNPAKANRMSQSRKGKPSAGNSRLDKHCEKVSNPRIKLIDKGSSRQAIILNPTRANHLKRRMDGGYIKNSTAADWMLSKSGTGDIFLELKGCDVTRAIEQIIATAEFALLNNLISGKVGALVLCTEHPGFNTKMQRTMQEFSKKFRGPVHARSRSGEFVFEHILSFNGPEKL
ncbi:MULTISPECIES: hypothetical protein [unclassified Xanthomonas]|uniref:hypothetical protein n=1 Tax=Xanthomonas sp. LMG 9002 TaxID=1591158 RepID=UPI00136EB811|nr:hypothetical protein [Xanthomonas sp. LMG 9002]